MDILFLSHCVPNPPDKGEKIRAFRALRYLAERYRVHLVCFAQNPLDETFAGELSGYCASVYFRRVTALRGIARTPFRFLLGKSLNLSFYEDLEMMRHVLEM